MVDFEERNSKLKKNPSCNLHIGVNAKAFSKYYLPEEWHIFIIRPPVQLAREYTTISLFWRRITHFFNVLNICFIVSN